ncbi:MAG TPA: ATP-binding protein [Polyangiaceae bacterium]|jgi:anti-sigma regulatory factor (Ser/Thr protein kinase)|nr:ATP-binding protein [Polyangiaceae bacterium]
MAARPSGRPPARSSGRIPIARPSARPPAPPTVVAINDDTDILRARYAVRQHAERLRFESRHIIELLIVVSELSTNILKYGVRGKITVDEVNDAKPERGLRIVASDIGPPFHDLALALQDGFGDRGPLDPDRPYPRQGIGAGLGAVVRFTDTFECRQYEASKDIIVVRYRRPEKRVRGKTI